MSNQSPEAGITPTPSENEYKLMPLGDDFEARAIRAEAIASAALGKLLNLNRGVTPPSRVEMRSVRPAIDKALDPYRNPASVRSRKEWEAADAELEAYDY